MVLLLLLVVAVSAFYAFAVWPRNGHGPGLRRAGRSADAAQPVAEAARPESLEGVLVAQLVAGDITRRQYRRAMGQLAARDDERSPMAVPPEGGLGGFDAAL
jgi:hypothetical protein